MLMALCVVTCCSAVKIGFDIILITFIKECHSGDHARRSCDTVEQFNNVILNSFTAAYISFTRTAPGVPGLPSTPGNPGLPEMPFRPGDPGNPGSPSEPLDPGIPSKPGSPFLPKIHTKQIALCRPINHHIF